MSSPSTGTSTATCGFPSDDGGEADAARGRRSARSYRRYHGGSAFSSKSVSSPPVLAPLSSPFRCRPIRYTYVTTLGTRSRDLGVSRLRAIHRPP
ncbi:hypothetical protein PUN28_015667 [Cardiocondyla obscurior]|uniref:Uncharacterized protein n=1 Tax=Cardiocondyla obscurior TaxID=286306 RepID=A0AAW2EWS8_9HYME